MTANANSRFNRFITDKNIKDSILKANPVPSNFIEVKDLETVMAHLMKGKSHMPVCTLSATFKG